MYKVLLTVSATLIAAFWLRYGTFDPCQAAVWRVERGLTSSPYYSRWASEAIPKLSGADCVRVLWVAETDPGAFR